MPAPWRRAMSPCCGYLLVSFNLKRDASPVATAHLSPNGPYCTRFQSQARCQPRGDFDTSSTMKEEEEVSISSEMPAPWRQVYLYPCVLVKLCFNLKRDASPVATPLCTP